MSKENKLMHLLALGGMKLMHYNLKIHFQRSLHQGRELRLEDLKKDMKFCLVLQALTAIQVQVLIRFKDQIFLKRLHKQVIFLNLGFT